MASKFGTQWSKRYGALVAAVFWAVACGGDDKAPAENDAGEEDGGNERDAAPRSDAGDAGKGGDSGADAGESDAAIDAGPIDPATPGNDKPTLSKVGYYNDDTWGPRVLVQGRDPNGDVKSYRLQLLKDGAPASVDQDGDGVLPSSPEWSASISSTPGEAGFFMRLDANLVFTGAVDQVIVTVTDAMNNVSEPMMSNKIGAAPMASSTCSPLGFDRCSVSNVCSPTTTNVYRCVSALTARQSACAKAPLLQPPMTAMVSGAISLPSLWEPGGCASEGSVKQPDAVFRLKLAQAAVVVLTVVGESTEFDSIVYLLGSNATACGNTTTVCTGATCVCEDASQSGLRNAELRVTLAQGDHYFAIDSSPQPENTGHRYAVSVTLE